MNDLPDVIDEHGCVVRFNSFCRCSLAQSPGIQVSEQWSLVFIHNFCNNLIERPYVPRLL